MENPDITSQSELTDALGAKSSGGKRKQVWMIISAVVGILASVSFGMFYMVRRSSVSHNQTQETQVSNKPSISETAQPPVRFGNITASSPPSILAYTRFSQSQAVDYVTGRAVIYDLSTHDSQDLAQLAQENDAFPVMGRWSDDGRYLPIYFSRGDFSTRDSLSKNPDPNPVYVYDVTENKMHALFDGSAYGFQGKQLFFQDAFRWDSKTTYSIILLKEASDASSKKLTGDLRGAVQKVDVGSDERLEYLKYGQFTLYAPSEQEHREGVVVVAKGTEEKRINGVVGMPFGIVDDWLFTADGLQTDLSGEPKPLIVHLYSLSGSEETKTFSVPDEGWTSVGVAIRPIRNTVVVNQVRWESIPSRFLEIDPHKPENKIVLLASDQLISFGTSNVENLLSSMETFAFSPDGNWIIAAVIPTAFTTGDKSIVAWNVLTKDKQVICDQSCLSVEVNNPLRMLYIH